MFEKFNATKVRQDWEGAKSKGLVRLRVEPSVNAWSSDDLFGDTFNPDVVDIDPAELKRQEKAAIDRANREGVNGIIGEYKCTCCGQWVQADSVWGFVGDDWKGSGYDLDVMSITLGELEDARGE